MKVTLNIEDDKELRDHIKDVIRGQVLSIVRSEISSILTEELNRKIKNTDEYAIKKIYSDSMVKSIHRILKEEHNVVSWNDNWIKPVIAQFVGQYVSQNASLIDQLAKEKVKSLL